ncbi:MAG: hypothetical protein IT370_23630 [Deltaproteobacteria bacterium]|nr:hypothetical protein [Deltaproteobacteria bacterium]
MVTKLGATRVLGLTLAVLLAGCGGDGGGDGAGDGGDTTQPPRDYTGHGPFVAGVTTYTVNGNLVEVWYPADKGAEAGKPKDSYDMRDWLPDAERSKIPDADAPRYPTDAYRDIVASRVRRFPVVLFSHGLGGYRLQSTFLMTSLAEWGFVVASPEHAGRGLKLLIGGMFPSADDSPAQLRDALAHLRSEDARAGGPLEGRMDFAHIAATGHSAGGATAYNVAKDPGITLWAQYAAGNGNTDAPAVPALVMGGTGDEIANIGTAMDNFAKLPEGVGKRFVGIKDAGHLAFADICAIGRDQGGVLKIAADHGIMVPQILITLGSDGCRPEDLPVEMAWPLIRHYTIAHLRLAFGLDAAPGLLLDDAGGVAKFGDRLFMYKHE